MSDLLPAPTDLGLPDKFASWRPGQPEAILYVAECDKPKVALILPTGFGKSITYLGLARMFGGPGPTVILTGTIALMDQLEGDVGSLPGVVIVKGQRRYLCKALAPGGELADDYAPSGHASLRTPPTVDQAPCHVGVACSLKANGCTYYDTLRAAMAPETTIIITNYAWWLSLVVARVAGFSLRPSILVLDEAHAAPDALADAVGATVSAELVARVFPGEVLPTAAQRTPENWVAWAKARAAQLRPQIEIIRQSGVTTSQEARTTRYAQTLLRAVDRIGRLDPDLLVTSDEKDAVRFDVVWAAVYGEQWLFRGVPRVVLTSATMSAHTMDLLGVPEGEVALYESTEGFPVARRPIFLAPATDYFGEPIRVDHRTPPTSLTCLLAHIDAIVGPRRDRKGIIHTISYERRNWLLQHSDHSQRMITHDTRNVHEQIARFRAAGPGTVLVSPAMTTGYDFAYTDAEYQIILKIPFPTTTDPVVKARTIVDKHYPAYLAMQQMVQMAGRAMRAADDQAETFIVDAHTRWFFKDHARLAPSWFRAAIRRLTPGTVPAPPPPLTRDAH